MSSTIDYGIDLGTTNSAIARFSRGKVEMMKDPTTWQETIPSVVAFRKGRILVGNSAQTYLPRDPVNVIGRFKRKIGTSETYYIESLDAPISPVQLSAHVLRTLKTHIQDGSEVNGAVITVPASFDIVQSNATIAAGKEAGISDVLLLQEPIAASLAYANLSQLDLADKTWLVYDLGGGTFDVALVRTVDGELRVLDHEGDNFLGGADFDRLIIERFVIPAIEEQFEEIDMATDLQSASGRYNSLFLKLLVEAEQAKKTLSTVDTAELCFEFDDESVEIEISRKELEDLLIPEIERTISLVQKVIERNQAKIAGIDFVLMIGGSTYIPYVRRRVEEALKVPVKSDVDPTTAVALGAAFYAGVRERSTPARSEPAERNLSIRAVYERASGESEELFTARVEGEIDGLFYQVRRDDGGFDSGLRPLTERISEDLPLVRDSFNNFTFRIYDTDNNVISVGLSEIGILHGHRVEGQKLSSALWLELDSDDGQDTYLQQIIERNTLLPARSSKRVRTNRQITASENTISLYLNVYQGDVEILPQANKRVAELTIDGDDLKNDLRHGAEVELRFEVSESQEISVTAFVEEADLEKHDTFNLRDDLLVGVDDLQEGLRDLRYKALRELEKVRESDPASLREQLRSLHEEIDILEDRSLELSGDDTTDQKYQFDSEMRSLAGELQTTIEKYRDDRVIEDYAEWKAKCEEAVAKARDEKLTSIFNSITADDTPLISSGSFKLLAVKVGQLEDLYWSAKWRDSTFITERFNAQLEYEENVDESESFQDLIEAGQIALIDENYDKLREITFKMHELRRKGYDRAFGKTGLSA